MAPTKRKLGKNVLDAARERIAWTFDTFSKIYVSFSAGKDSTVMLHLVMDEAIKRNRKVGVMLIDWEAQYQLTIEHAQELFNMYANNIDLYWIALPFLTTNACSQFEPEWICWETGRENDWVRQLPSQSINDYKYFLFYSYAMTFEEFVPKFGHWYSEGKLTACFVGIRSDESLNRWRTIAGHGGKFEGRNWTNWLQGSLYNIYPLYDWKTEDIWTYHGKHPDKPHNQLYERMYQAGLSINSMRICEPYGDEQRKGLHLFSVIEPETWGKVVARVSGANNGAIYAKESGNVMGNIKVAKPANHTWKSFAEMLLESMPEKTSEHYKDKISVWLNWYRVKEGIYEIHDELPGDTGMQDKPSWRRICKMLLKNDYWCKMLCFAPTKATAYEKYKRLMKKRRQSWGIYG